MDASDPKFRELVRRALSDEDERITAETVAVFGIDGELAERRTITVCIQSGDHTVVLKTGDKEKRLVIPASLIKIAEKRKKLPIRRRTKLIVEDEYAYLDYEEEFGKPSEAKSIEAAGADDTGSTDDTGATVETPAEDELDPDDLNGVTEVVAG